MVEGIKQVMSQILGIAQESITADASAETIESWDSLKHMQLVLALEEELGIQFPDDVIPDLVSFEAIQMTVRELTGT